MSFNNAKILKVAREKAESEIRKMVTVMGNDALNHYKQSFINEGFTDNGLVKWKKRKRDKRGVGRAVLTKTGTLRRSLRKTINGYSATISSNVKYASIHNNGGEIHKYAQGRMVNFKIGRGGRSRFAKKKKANFQQPVTFGEHNISMPKRQFVGYSSRLNNNLRAKFDKKIRAIFQ